MFFFATLLCAIPAGLSGQGLRITVSIPDLPEKDVILSHRLGMKFYTDDTVRTDSRGKAVFESPASLPEGMYQLVLPDKKFAEFFLGKNQEFGIRTRASAPADSLTFTGSRENSRFIDWQRKYAANRNRTAWIQNRLKAGNVLADSMILFNKELQQIQQANNKLWDSAIHDLDGTLPGSFIRGLKPVKIPESLGKPDNPEHQRIQYQYLKNHFFDGVDFTDERLLRTPLVETKLDQYFKQIAPPVADSLIPDARRVIEMARPVATMYQFVVQFLFNLYSDPEIMGTDAVYVFIAENYYLAGQTPWIDSANLRGINTRVQELKPLLIGKPAPAVTGLVTDKDVPFEISQVKSKYLILYFWSPECSFCKESTPKLHAQYEDLKKLGVEVVAIDTRPDKVQWYKFIADHQLSWINVYSPQYERELVERYQAFSTPALFILDSERRIIAKNISVDQVKPFFNQYLSGK
jgi:thiol-disulfide isomerase/thioredoxin